DCSAMLAFLKLLVCLLIAAVFSLPQWTYEWRAAKLNTPPTSNEYRINSTTESDSGGYSCRGRRSSSWTEWSDITLLKLFLPPTPDAVPSTFMSEYL
uniref:Ig-like domain-containing protein n=1 Tax=Oreochromis niloticus TaxID=8128 RepID=A0A669CVY8_ORENI